MTESDVSFEDVLSWYESGYEQDPLHLFAGEALMQAADATGLNVVAVLQDELVTSTVAATRAGKPLRDVIDELMARSEGELDDGWITVRPGTHEAALERFDREKAAEFALRTYEDGWQRIEPLADLTTGCDGAWAFNYARQLSDILQPVRTSVRTIDTRQFRLLELYASLSPEVRKQAKDGGAVWPITQVSGTTRTRLMELISHKDLGQFATDRLVVAWPQMFVKGLPSVPFSPSDIPADASLEIVYEQARLFAYPDSRSDRSFSTPSLKTVAQLAETVYWTRKADREGTTPEEYRDMTRTVAIVDAERLVIRLNVPGGRPYYAAWSADSRSSATRYMTFESLEGEEAEAAREAVRKLEGGGPGIGERG